MKKVKQHIDIQQQIRLDHLHKFCNNKSQGLHTVNSLDHIFVDDKHKVLYCAIPKAGCSAWKWNLIVLNTNDSSLKLDGIVHDPHFLEK